MPGLLLPRHSGSSRYLLPPADSWVDFYETRERGLVGCGSGAVGRCFLTLPFDIRIAQVLGSYMYLLTKPGPLWTLGI